MTPLPTSAKLGAVARAGAFLAVARPRHTVPAQLYLSPFAKIYGRLLATEVDDQAGGQAANLRMIFQQIVGGGARQ